MTLRRHDDFRMTYQRYSHNWQITFATDELEESAMLYLSSRHAIKNKMRIEEKFKSKQSQFSSLALTSQKRKQKQRMSIVDITVTGQCWRSIGDEQDENSLNGGEEMTDKAMRQ